MAEYGNFGNHYHKTGDYEGGVLKASTDIAYVKNKREYPSRPDVCNDKEKIQGIQNYGRNMEQL